MSDIYYSTIVKYIKGRRLLLKYHGKVIFAGLHDIKIKGLPKEVTEIEYYPELGQIDIRERCDRLREMERPEIQALDKWLKRISRSAAKWLME